MTKAITVRDLKTFIEAVEFAADQADWVPSPRQWAKIRTMINDLEEAPQHAPQPPQMTERYAPLPTPAGPAPQYQLAPTGLAGNVPPRPSAQQAHLPAFSTTNGALRTPDIDTSSGGYTSGFV